MKYSATDVSIVPRLGNSGKLSKTIGYYSAFAALGVRLGSLGPTLPGLAEQAHTNLSGVSFLFVAHAFGYLVGSLQGGRLYDHLPGHRVMASMLFAMAAITASIPLLSLVWLLDAAFLLLGIAESIVDVGSNTLCLWVHRDKAGPYLSGLYFFVACGAFFSPLIVAKTTLSVGGITWAYWIFASLIVPAALILLLLPSPTIPRASDDDEGGRLNNIVPIVLISFFLFLHVGSSVGYDGWVFSYTFKLGLANKVVAAYVTSAYWGSIVVGRLLTIPIAARFKPSTILFGAMLGNLVSLGVILFWPTSLMALILGTCGLGLSMASLSPATFSLAERIVPITGRVTGGFVAGISGGALFIPWVIGQFFESTGPKATMLTITSAMVLALGVLAVLVVHYRGSGDF